MALGYQEADGWIMANILVTMLMFGALIGFLILRQMMARRVRRAVVSSGLANNRIFQVAAVGFLLFMFARALGTVMIVFVALFLVLGLAFTIANKLNPGLFQRGGGNSGGNKG